MFISLDIAIDFYSPKFRIILWPYEISTPLMAVPKAPVNKNHSLIFGKYDIWFSRQPDIVLTIPKALRKKKLPHHFFGLCVFAANPGHIVTSLFWCQNVCHKVSPNSICFLQICSKATWQCDMRGTPALRFQFA